MTWAPQEAFAFNGAHFNYCDTLHVAPRIESRGAQWLYLPPYSPDFNPIEQAWSVLKQRLRGIKARVVEHLELAVAEAMTTITAEHARGFFHHCGYGIQQP